MKTVIFRPTNKCNLRCTYCYDKNNHDCTEESVKKSATDLFKREEDNIVDCLDKLYDGEKNPKIIFHGGEPLLIKADALDDFLKKITKKRKLGINIQTNGTLIDEDYIELFKKYNFGVGLSLDGCNEIQNHARVYPNGNNSLPRVLDRMKLLQDNGVKFGVIMSINKAHNGCENELYDFIAENNLSCNIRPVFASDPETAKQVMSTDEYVAFFKNLFDIWFNDSDKRVGTRQINELYQNLCKALDSSYSDRYCSNSDNCFQNFISLDILGNLYACNRLYGVSDYYYGNLKDMSMDDVNKKINGLLEMRNLSISDECADCKSFDKCHGGCPAESYGVYGDILHPTPECEINQKVLKYVKEKI